MYTFPRAAITNDHRPSGLKQDLFSHGSGSQKSVVKVWAGPHSLEGSKTGFFIAFFYLLLVLAILGTP